MAILKPFVCGRFSIYFPDICGDMPYFIGADDETIKQGTEFDLYDGVTAYDKDGYSIPFSVNPSTIETCQVGTQTFIYEADGTTHKRKITVQAIANPTITGLTAMTVGVNEAISTLNGVSATDGNGNIIEVTCTEGTIYTPTAQGTIYLHYTATDGCGNETQGIRTVNVIDGSFTGIDDVTLNQGQTIDLRSGVTATDWQGNTVPFTVTPTEIIPCEVGEQEVIYSAVGVSDTVRTITVEQADDPTITGLTPISVSVGEEFDPSTGVSATDDNGNTLTVSYVPSAFSGIDDVTINQGVGIDLREGVHAVDTEGNILTYTVNPSTIAKCDVGTHTVTYTSSRATETRTVTISAIADPTISGADSALAETVGVDFDPLDGVTAVDGNGNTVTVTVTLV